MTLREVPRWAYVALALLWTSTVLFDAAAISLDPQLSSVSIPWVQFFAKRGLLALFWMGVSVAALAWFHDRPVTAGNVVRMFGATSVLAIATVALYGGYLTVTHVVVTLGETSFRESFGIVWSGKLVQAFVTAWLVAILANACHDYRRALAKQRESEMLRLKLAETELSRLRAQLEPHFLFNALNSIASLMRLQRNEQATDALGKLGRLLRGMLEVGEQPIVRWEWERGFTDQYVALQELRFGSQLVVALRSDGVPASTPVPAFLLQPLIENAIRHGPLADGETCKVEVDVRRQGERAHVMVRNAVSNGERSSRGAGVGLRNIESRMAALYPDDYGFSSGIDRDSFVVRVDFPVRAEGAVQVSGPL
jgi:hypothetical protein